VEGSRIKNLKLRFSADEGGEGQSRKENVKLYNDYVIEDIDVVVTTAEDTTLNSSSRSFVI
jgi:hypothetical protein